METCTIRGCDRPVEIQYLAGDKNRKRGICWMHWLKHCKDEINLKNELVYKRKYRGKNIW